MAISSSFPKVADQILSFNKNIIDILSKINTLTTTTEPSVNLQVYNENGVMKSFNIPSINSLKAEIDRLNNNINSLYSIDITGSMIQTSPNTFKKVITVDLNREPGTISSLGEITTFKSKPNWFFDSMLNPMINIEIDLSGQIEDNVRKVFTRRYIVDFAKDSSGNLTSLGQSALNSFNTLFRGNSTINIDEFENWHKTTPGIVDPLNPRIDEQLFDLEPNEILYEGTYNVLSIEEDRVNKKLWYVLNTLDYLDISLNQMKELKVGDDLIINMSNSSSRYKINEISNSGTSPKVSLERVEGMDAVPVGYGMLKVYSPILYKKNVMISVGYNERNTLFIKAINTDSNLLSRSWSLGSGYWTNDLRFNSNGPDNGISMEQFYVDYVYDYGTVLQDLVSKKTPNKLSGTPNSPLLSIDNFKVVQINKHLTDTPDSNLIKQKHNYQQTLKSEITQIQESIIDKNKKAKTTKFATESTKRQYLYDIDELVKKKENISKLLISTNKEILDLSNNTLSKVDPVFRIRGFWSIPDAVATRSTKPQEIVQFRVQYRYLSKDGKETPVETFKLDNSQKTAAFSNWTEFKTDARKRVYNKATGGYTWEIEDVSSADTPNINQIDIPIRSNEKVEVRIKSISEVGWPESPVESEWSDILTVDFPDDLNNVLNENQFILQEATKEDLKSSVSNELASKGLDDHLSDTFTMNNKTYHHESNKIISGFKDENGVSLDLFEYLKKLEDRVKTLEEKIKRSKGELEVVILRKNQEFVISNGSEVTFNVECEDYLRPYKATGIPQGRVYENGIYVIKDFVVKIRNKSMDSPLGLVSSKKYFTNTNIYNPNSPQVFWVNDQDELLTSDYTGQSKTQLDGQYIWMTNYDSLTTNTINKLSENIGNNFKKEGTNVLTNILSSTEYNLGYYENNILSFVANNKSLLDQSKWIDKTQTQASTVRLLTTIHPVVKKLENLVEINTEGIKNISPGDKNSLIVPLNIYFKMNSLNSNQNGLNYNYINLNNIKDTIKHVKKVKFMLENESTNKPFTFTIKFNINRSKVITYSPLDSISPYIQDVNDNINFNLLNNSKSV
jgi:hypothetical protein